MKVGYLGPAGTFSEEVAIKLFPEASLLPVSSIPEVLQKANSGEVSAAIVPIENSIEGSVTLTLDNLMRNENLFIQGEYLYPISHNLIGLEGAKLSEIKKVLSHPQALAQCQGYLESNYPHIQLEGVLSTAEAVERVAVLGDLSLGAIGTKRAASLRGMSVLQAAIEDYSGNTTRFIVVGRYPISKGAGAKTSMAFTVPHSPGALYKILGILYEYGINMNKIESRPTKVRLGEYLFFVDIEGSPSDERVLLALDKLRENCASYRYLGSYGRIEEVL